MNLVLTYDPQNNFLDEDDPWSGILADTDFSVRSTYDTTLQATPDQLVLGRDMILNTPIMAKWGSIRLRKQKIIDQNNQLENKNRKPHTYIIQDKLLVHKKKPDRYEEPYADPYLITQLWNNGNVTIRQGAGQECINIRWIKTYHE